MTAKKIVRQILDDGIMTEEKAIALINQHTLSVIEKAVADEVEEWHPYLGAKALIACNRILTRIKNELGE